MVIGLDTNILCYALDEAYPEHERLRDLLLNLSPEERLAINPTIIQEAYHTLVYGQKWVPSEAVRRLKMLLKHPCIEFFGQTRRTCTVALSLAERYRIGGRDALIVANFLTNKVETLYTHDYELLIHGTISWKNLAITIEDPLA